MSKFSRRALLGGAAASLPLLHELVPHQKLHHAIEGAEASTGGHGHANGGSPGGANGGAASHGHGGFNGAEVDHRRNGFNPTDILRDFDWGRTRRLPSGRVLREWDLVAADQEIEVAPGVFFPGWTYNGRVPGPTLRCRSGEKLRINFVNASTHPHTIHFHGIHPALMDGMPGTGEGSG